jgi:hypothetical protein
VNFGTDGRALSATQTPITGASPTGAAGGALTGSYPNPGLAPTGVTATTYGNQSGYIPIITLNNAGQVTFASQFFAPSISTAGAFINQNNFWSANQTSLANWSFPQITVDTETVYDTLTSPSATISTITANEVTVDTETVNNLISGSSETLSGTLGVTGAITGSSETLTENFEAQGNNFYNVKLHGAKGDGSTDDTVAIQNTINIATATGGGIVYLPAGIYDVSNSIYLSSNTILEGANYTNFTVPGLSSPGLTQIKYTGTNCSLPGVVIAQGYNFQIKNIGINTEYENCGNDLAIGYQSEARTFSIDNVDLNNGVSGITFGTGTVSAASGKLNNVYIENVSTGIIANALTDTMFSDVDIYFCSSIGIDFVGNSDTNYFYQTFIGEQNGTSSWDGIIFNSGVPSAYNDIYGEEFFGLTIASPVGDDILMNYAQADIYGARITQPVVETAGTNSQLVLQNYTNSGGAPDTQFTINSPNATPFSVNGSTFVVTTSNVGIGTSSPNSTLEVVNPGSASGTKYIVEQLDVNSGNQDAGSVLAFGDAANASQVWLESNDEPGFNSDFIIAVATGGPQPYPVADFFHNGNVGIGTLSPGKLFTVAGNADFGSGTPTLSSCGTSPSLDSGSNDMRGEIVVGTSATGCTLTFSAAKTNTPFCIVASETSGLTSPGWTESTTAITITGVTAGDDYAYMCMGN